MKNCAFIFSIFLLTACGSYRQNIMFRTSDQTQLASAVKAVEQNYVIARGDKLEIEVYTNKGEKLIDPNNEMPGDGQPAASGKTETTEFIVDQRGIVKLPMIGEIKIESLTLRQAEQMLEKAYEGPFVDAYVRMKFTNKRVVVLGSPGGQVIPLANENVRLTEILALSKGISVDGKAHNIRVIRNNEVHVVDFSTFESYVNNDMIMQSGDIIYVEPVRRAFLEGLRDVGPILSLITSLGTLAIVVIQSSK